MQVDLEGILRKTVPVDQYIDHIEEPFREKFLQRKQTYELCNEAAEELKKSAPGYKLIVFSASWCKDCAQNVPVLALIAEKTGLEICVFGGLKKDPLSQTHKWRIPPSPVEVTTFNVDKLPLIIVFDSSRTEIGRIVESAKRCPTLEQELCEIIKSHQQSFPALRRQ